MNKPKLLLHICCAGCGAYVSEVLKDDYNVELYYYNPSIFPKEEYYSRQDEVVRVAKQFDLKYHLEDYDHRSWLNKVKGLEAEPEKGRRCYVCYEDRLRQSARFAKENNFTHFTTTLTVSPHKIAEWIFELGLKFAKENNIIFLDKNFKKQDGFKKACELSKEFNLHRQNYCGCEFSMRK
jgi:predicted adenine nucleotide alpha hydrolase (AANH) superfamily ATPase